MVYCCCGRVVFNANNKEVAGYVMDKTRWTWMVKLITNVDIEIRKVKLNKETHQYTFDSAQCTFKVGRTRYKIKSFHPIRILVSKKRCAWKMSLNCLVLDENDNTVLEME